MRVNDKENYDKIKSNISMKNLKTIMKNKGFSAVTITVNLKISDSTISTYIKKIPSLPTLISMEDCLNCNLDYLLDKIDNPININNLNKSEEDKELNQLFKNEKDN